MDKVLLYVGQELLKQRVLLLPTVHNVFKSYHQQFRPKERTEPVSAMCILGNLIGEFQHHLKYSCAIRKYGTLLYRRNTDLTKPLQQVL